MKVAVKRLAELRKYAADLTFPLIYAACNLEKTDGGHTAIPEGGFSFNEHRMYQQGDSSKRIDWSVSARRGSLWVKQFYEEAQTSLVFVIDFSSGMFFSSQLFLKAIIALEAMVLLGWQSIDNQQNITCLVMTEQDNHLFTAQNSVDFHLLLEHLCALYHQCRQQPVKRSDHSAWFSRGLHQIKSLCQKQQNIVLISDFINTDSSTSLYLNILCNQHKVVALRVLDPLESGDIHLSSGFFSVTDGKSSSTLFGHNQKSQQQFNRVCKQHFQQVKRQLVSYGACFADLTTKAAVHKQLHRMIKENINVA